MNDLLSSCSEINFGNVSLTPDQKKFQSDLNDEIIFLCKSLPESTQTEALLFLLKELRSPVSVGINFVGYYYVPTWSIIYWLCEYAQGNEGPDKTDIKYAKTAHSMAMFLHAFDDHINDNELPATHLTLLLRSQAWMIMNNAMNKLAEKVEDGKEIVREFIDEYYSGIQTSRNNRSLDSYCDLFKKQMATGFVVPFLIAKKVFEDKAIAGRIQRAFGSFGIAWRLLDDLKDIETDMMNGHRSAVYVCLPEETKTMWDKNSGVNEDKSGGYRETIYHSVIKNRVVDKIRDRICVELEKAASIADDCHIPGLANEFRCLLKPLEIGGFIDEWKG